jgi:hypothetical protein
LELVSIRSEKNTIEPEILWRSKVADCEESTTGKKSNIYYVRDAFVILD